MKLTVVGSADAMNSCGRGNSCYLLEGDADGQLMVDFGPTALAMLKRLKVDLAAIAGVVFTHLHGDHTGGFPLLCIETMFGRSRRAELSVLGPPLSEQTLGEVFRVAYAELVSEVPERMRLSIQELSPGQERTLAGYTVRAFAADHMAPPHQALCLRITDRSGRSVAFSGDSRICPGLLEAATGADLLVADCSRVAPPAGAHATWQEWRVALPTLRARALLLTHLGEDMRERGPELLAEGTWPISVRLADDGMVIEI